MALHPDLPTSPYVVSRADQRWFPASEDLRTTRYENLLPPLVAKIREEVSAWRDGGYQGASATSKALLKWWFLTPHQVEQADWRNRQKQGQVHLRSFAETGETGSDSLTIVLNCCKAGESAETGSGSLTIV